LHGYISRTDFTADNRASSAAPLFGVRWSALVGVPYFVIQEFYLIYDANQFLAIFCQ